MSGWFWDTFNTTEKMSTYLVAMIVANYKYEESAIKLPGGKPVRVICYPPHCDMYSAIFDATNVNHIKYQVYAPPDMIDRKGGVYGSNTSAKVMTFYEEYFQMNFKMPKMDSASIPAFTFGAMENWGLITYRFAVFMI